MSQIKVITGYGYYQDQAGNVIAKAQLPPGDHELNKDLTYHEVGSQAELDVIDVYINPIDVQKKEQEEKIQNKIREIAINELIADGDWP